MIVLYLSDPSTGGDVLQLADPYTPPAPPEPPAPLPGTGVMVQSLPQPGSGGGGIDDGLDLVARRTLILLVGNMLKDISHTEVENLETSVVVSSLYANAETVSTETGVNVGQHDIAGSTPSVDSSVDVSELDVSVDPGDTDD